MPVYAMIIEIIKANEKVPSVGDIYIAKNYAYDSEKYTLTAKLDPITRNVIEEDSLGLMNEYKSNCKVID